MHRGLAELRGRKSNESADACPLGEAGTKLSLRMPRHRLARPYMTTRGAYTNAQIAVEPQGHTVWKVPLDSSSSSSTYTSIILLDACTQLGLTIDKSRSVESTSPSKHERQQPPLHSRDTTHAETTYIKAARSC